MPFPFVEANYRRKRPGLVISKGIIPGPYNIVWVAMITGAGHSPWPDDVDVGPGHAEFGLAIPSRIRVAKIAAITTDQTSLVGRIDQAIQDQVMANIRSILTHND